MLVAMFLLLGAVMIAVVVIVVGIILLVHGLLGSQHPLQPLLPFVLLNLQPPQRGATPRFGHVETGRSLVQGRFGTGEHSCHHEHFHVAQHFVGVHRCWMGGIVLQLVGWEGVCGRRLAIVIMIIISIIILIGLVLLRNDGDGFDLPADDGTVEPLRQVAAVL